MEELQKYTYKTFRGTKYSYTELPNGVVEILLDEDVELDINDAKEIFEVGAKFTNGVPARNLTIVAEGCSATIEALKYFGNKEFKNPSIAEAIVIRSLGQRLLADFLVRLVKGNWPMKIFSKREDAIEWLMKQGN